MMRALLAPLSRSDLAGFVYPRQHGAQGNTPHRPPRPDRQVTCLAPGFPRQASTDHWESADRIDPALAAEATESTDATELTEPIDKMDPLEPMLRIDPLVFRMGSILAGTKVRAGPRIKTERNCYGP